MGVCLQGSYNFSEADSGGATSRTRPPKRLALAPGVARGTARRLAWIRITLLAAFAVLGKVSPAVAADQELRILTSMPDNIYQPFIDAFAKISPGDRVTVLNKDTNASVDEIARGNPRRFDIFWASSGEAFDVIGASGFSSSGDGSASGSAPFHRFALTSVGWCWRRDMPGPIPKNWEDLLAPAYEGRIAIARPSHSGTAHMFVERMLQDYGWERGWAYLLELAGNLSTVAARSFSVTEGVSTQRFDFGIAIDYLAFSNESTGLSFSYGKPILISEARIGILRGGEAPEVARRFVDFVLSEDGQRLLLLPQVRRIPAVVKLQSHPDAPITPEFAEALKSDSARYNFLIAGDRYWAINTLFDEFVTLRLPERKALWRRYRILAAQHQSRFPAELADIQRRLRHMPVPENAAAVPELNHSIVRGTRFTALTQVQMDTATQWRALAQSENDGIAHALSALEDKVGNATK
jgi:phosphoglycerate transport regulatory protein PgtC